jgi:hypothetical protein
MKVIWVENYKDGCVIQIAWQISQNKFQSSTLIVRVFFFFFFLIDVNNSTDVKDNYDEETAKRTEWVVLVFTK